MDMGRSPAKRYADVVHALGDEAGEKRHWARAWRAVTAFDPEHMHTIVHGARVRKLLENLGYPHPADPRTLAQREQVDEIDQATQYLMQQVDKRLPGLSMLERSIAPWLMYKFFEEGGPIEVLPDAGPPSPFFVFFDEMNLARVEYYFAEFLSVLESGRRNDGFTREAIRLHEFDKPVSDSEGNTVPPEIHLPPNLYFVGTVNVDETTHAFSPKVLDRAFTIEFEAADLAGYLTRAFEADSPLDETEREQLVTSFARAGRFAQIDKNRILRVHVERPEYTQRLRDLESRLRPHDLHFGYRVVDEILMFLANAEDHGWYDGLGGMAVAFDQAVNMKILPKFHGPRSHLEDALWAVLEWAGVTESARQTFNTALSSGATQAFAALTESAALCQAPATARKCLRMLRSLYTTGFAAFS